MDRSLDVSNLRRMIFESPKQCETGFHLARGIKVAGGPFTAVMLSGMGGSALPGDLLRTYLDDLFQSEALAQPSFALFQNRSYALPREGLRNCLHFVCSYSGNTEETLTVFEAVLEHRLPCVALSAGGKLEALALEHGVPHIKLPIPFAHFQPRVGTGYFFAAILQVLINQELVPNVTEELLSDARALEGEMAALEQAGAALAERIAGRTPVIYAADEQRAVAMIWKIKFNENAKTPAFWNFFPELNHNEMVGWTLPQGKFLVLMLRDREAHPQILKRFEITAALLREKGVTVEILDMGSGSVYSRIFRSIALGDFASYALALTYGQDPTPVAMVEALKKRLT